MLLLKSCSVILKAFHQPLHVTLQSDSLLQPILDVPTSVGLRFDCAGALAYYRDSESAITNKEGTEHEYRGTVSVLNGASTDGEISELGNPDPDLNRNPRTR